MKKSVLLILAVVLCMPMMAQQVSQETLAKREKRKNLVVKEWNTDTAGKVRWLDHLTVYDEEGRKIEEIEYTTYGQKERITYEYGEHGRVVKEVVYDDRNKVSRVRKYEYTPDGKKAKQYNYLPNGKLFTIKTFEYITE